MEKQKQEPAYTGIIKALGEFQSLCPAIKKEKTAGAGKFTYKYGSLAHILEAIKPHMKKAGLAFTQPIVVQDGIEYILTILFEMNTGEKIESRIPLPEIKFQGMNELQSKGSVITYLRRYGLMSLLGLVTEEDDNDAQGKTEPKAEPVGEVSKVATLPWLNPEPKDKWNAALKYLSDGGKIGDIKKKYKLSKANEERLLNDAISFDDLPFDREATEEAEIISTEDRDFPDIGPGNSNTLFDEQGQQR